MRITKYYTALCCRLYVFPSWFICDTTNDGYFTTSMCLAACRSTAQNHIVLTVDSGKYSTVIICLSVQLKFAKDDRTANGMCPHTILFIEF